MSSPSRFLKKRKNTSVFSWIVLVCLLLMPVTVFSEPYSSPHFLQHMRAAKQGSPESQNRVGTMFFSGHGVGQNKAAAAFWYEQASKQGHAKAQINLGMMYLVGQGVTENPRKADFWFRQAAKQNHAEAQTLLGQMAQYGSYTKKDPVQALQWYTLAAEQGSPLAKQSQKKLIPTLTAEQVTQASILIEEIRSKGWVTEKDTVVLSVDQTNQKRSVSKKTEDFDDEFDDETESSEEDVIQENTTQKSEGPSALEAWQTALSSGMTEKKPETSTSQTKPLKPLLSIPTLPKKATDREIQKAKKEANLGNQFLKKASLEQALKQYQNAHDLNPFNTEYLHNATQLGLQVGDVKTTLELLRQAVQLAVVNNNRSDGINYNKKISELLYTMPNWVEEKLAVLADVPREKIQAIQAWSNLHKKTVALSEKGEINQAILAGQQALDGARKNLGVDHLTSFTSGQLLATLYEQGNYPKKAEALLDTLIPHAESALGQNHPKVAEFRTQLAILYENQAKLDKAFDLYQKNLVHLESGLGVDHPEKLQMDLAVVRTFQNLGHLEEANKRLPTICKQFSDQFGFYHEETANCLQQYALTEKDQGAYPAAHADYKQLTLIQKTYLEKTDPNLLNTQNGLAELAWRQGHYEEAKTLLEEILKLNPTSSEAKTTLARLFSDLGLYLEAEKLAREVLQQQTQTLGADHANTLAIRTDLAGIIGKQGHIREAEKELSQVLEHYKKLFGEAHPTTITVLNNLGQMREGAGLYDDAEPILRRAVALAEKVFGPDHATTLATLNNLALLHESQGNFDKAEPLYQRAIAASSKQLGKRHSDTVALINNLAFLHLLRQDYAKADPLFETISTVWNETLGKEHQRTLKSLNSLARTKHHLGQHDTSEKLFLDVLKRRANVLGQHHKDTLRSMHDLADLYHTMGQHEKAEKLLRETLRLDEKVLGSQHPYTFETLNTLAKVLESSNKIKAALKLRRRGFNRRTKFFNQMLWATGENAREGYIRLYKPELDAYVSLLSKTDPQTSGHRIMEIGLQRKGLLLKIASEIHQIAKFSDDSALNKLTQQLTETRKKLAALTLSGPTEETGDQHLTIIHGLEQKIDELQLLLGQSSQRFRNSITSISMDTLIGQLPEDAVLVNFITYEENEEKKILAATLRKENGQPIFDLVVYPDKTSMEQKVIDFRSIIQDEDAEEDELFEIGQDTYDLVWDPLKASLKNRNKVYLVPDGILNILPFAALISVDQTYLAQSTDLHFLGSSRDLIPSDIPDATGEFLILAGPDYDSEKVVAKEVLQKAERRRSANINQSLRAFSSGMRGLRFDPLPGAEKEGKIIALKADENHKKNKILVKNEAQEGVFHTIQNPPEILHIATHGFFLKPDQTLRRRLLKLQRGADVQLPPPGDNPLLRAGLAFAGINTNAKYLGEIDTNNDGVLTALEVLDLDFTGTRLAVLSACETGLGEIHEGEGVYGLRRSFQEAGVNSVISSLWEVSDAGTQALMASLYQRIGKGLSPHEALRASQLEMIQSKEWSYPYIWSAFMMVGR